MTDDITGQIPLETLNRVLGRLLGADVTRAGYRTRELQGGTLGDVRLVSGIAVTEDGGEWPYQVVLKKQKKWERPGDPDSWRREYDLYRSELDGVFTEALRRPAGYHAEMNAGEDEIQVWMEYIDGVSGGNLTVDMLEQAAMELGRFQGRTAGRPGVLGDISCLGDPGFMEQEFAQWHTQSFTYDYLISEPCQMSGYLKKMLKDGGIRLADGKSFEYSYLRSEGCDIPDHLKRMLMDIDDRRKEIFKGFEKLPVVLCHRDFWNENIFLSDGGIWLIDWDTSGWSFAGEDIASLIVDGMGVDRFEENVRQLIPAYVKGLSEHMDAAAIDEDCVLTMVLIKFGYRMLQEYMFSDNPEEKAWGVNALQKIYEMRNTGT